MKNVQLHYSGGLQKVRTAVEKTNEILSSEEFYDQIRAYKKFDNSSLSPDVISKLLKESGQKIDISVYWLVPVIKTRHDRIGVSGWDFSSNLATGVNTLVYETVNSIDRLYDILNNDIHEKNTDTLTASWVIGAIAEVMVK